MTNDELKSAVLSALARIAPEGDYASLRPDQSLRDQLDIDSMDFMNFVVLLHQELGVDVPEAEYASVSTLDGCVAWLAAHGAHPAAQGAGGAP